MSGLDVVRLRHGPFWNFSYILACLETREAAVIDPAWDVAGILESAAARGWAIKSVFLTHSHSDHTNGAGVLAETTGARIFARVEDAAELRLLFDSDPVTFGSDAVLNVGDIPVTAMHSPGHTRGSVSFLAGGHLFAGDTLNVRGPGTPGPEPGALEQLWQSTVDVLGGLPDETVLHPGHDSGPSPDSLLGRERRENPGLRARSLAEFVEAVERSTGRRHSAGPVS